MVAVAVAALSVIYAKRLSQTMKPWHDAAVVSGTIARELRALEPQVSPGAALFLDVREIHNGAYIWTWAVAFALRPPFTEGRLDQRAIVLESRGLYIDWERWHVQPALEAMRNVETESWILEVVVEDRPPRRIAVAPEKMRAGVERFAAAPLKEFPHESWRKLINELTAP